MSTGKITGFYHAGITVNNLEESLRFYCDFLGFQFLSQQNVTDEYVFNIVSVPETSMIKIAFVQIPGSTAVVELLEYVGVERHSGSCRPCDYGTGHLCLYVEKLDLLYKELCAKGVKFRSEAPVNVTSGRNKGAKIIYCLDPDGYIVELVEPANNDGR
ncbi:VOC family protein [Aneurinibacillus aneurinilyticus]|uniref:Glyoxalase family protein n=1 Tax=Aneurinibacillus aneurinilyticus ATCC 12856 TaxID=649747 RepID=U1X358_ANEAE|nr:VOC family protein [Aneurinibacillus aneurinilyticus]ERI09410.1 glyoxalase family protein [Aneurinibacillus aneurinilyticus ATCC 12856]MCI1696051.1 VOC family protein [Aneurinibacillus aneurinilyticus]MED0668687.1 VOC family protein [Aneurinibacillus aneurinilyticus]MED0707618.1 VOC family protein [Aneurinibacillus aneurinilyticus]MED0722842.1 VOC family protein [Aneurinibacillus aneurinilyticus]